jgi:arylsulfatase
VRKGRWKLHVAHDYLEVAAEPGQNGKPSNWGKMNPLSIENSGIAGIASRHGYRVETLPESLFDLETDVAESTNASASHPSLVRDLLAIAAKYRSELGDSLTKTTGTGCRPSGISSANPRP